MATDAKKEFARGFLEAQGLTKEQIEEKERKAEEERKARDGGYLVKNASKK